METDFTTRQASILLLVVFIIVLPFVNFIEFYL